MLLLDQFEPKLKTYSVQTAGNGATLVNRPKTARESRKIAVVFARSRKIAFSAPLRTATSAKPSRPSNALPARRSPYFFLDSTVVIAVRNRSAALERKQRREDRNLGSARQGGICELFRRGDKQIRFNIMILTFRKKSQCFNARKPKKRRKTPDFTDYTVDPGNRLRVRKSI